jgi:tyrosyl-tRNA synthetase
MRSHALLDELQWRGLLYQHTEQVADALNADQVRGYVGFDPTAASLHIGNLLPIMLLVHLQRHGHSPVALVGGGTGLIGDPSGRSSERMLASPEVIAANAGSIRAQLEHFLDFNGAAAARMIDNAEWLVPLNAIEFMRDVGKHFTVNYMLQKDSVRARMDAGISYTEFSYMLLQAYDFLELQRRHGVLLQMGGSDQWGNITAGIELIRRTTGADAHAITAPLVTTADGRKFGKSEGGNIWLDPALTSPYKFHQFWLNVDDREAPAYLRFYTLFDQERVQELVRSMESAPEQRELQRALADDITRRVHGDAALATAQEMARLLFGGAPPRELSSAALQELAREIPCATFDAHSVGDRPADTLDLLEAVTTPPAALFKSKGDARRLVQQGGVSLNGERLSTDRVPLSRDVLLHGRYALIRKGARNYALITVTGLG